MGRGGLVVIYNDKMLEVNKTTNKQMRELYESGSGVILTVGDGDFSFSAALATSYKVKQRLIATSYDNHVELASKYSSTVNVCLETLNKLKVPVLHNVDATQLYQTLEVSRIKASRKPEFLPIPTIAHSCSRIIFNFPNMGNLGAESTKLHQELIKKFLIQCMPLLSRPTTSNGFETGEVHIALRNTPFYAAWNIEDVAQQAGYRCASTAVFKTENYPGYQEMRTNPGIFRAAPPKVEGATIYRFVIDEKFIPELEKAGCFKLPEVDVTKLNQYQRTALPTEIAEEELDESLAQDTKDALFVEQDDENDKTKDPTNTTTSTSTNETSKTQQKQQQQQQQQQQKEINPYHIVDIKFKDAANAGKAKKLPVYDQAPNGCIVYQPIYPFCPAPPPAPKTTPQQQQSQQTKVKAPFGLFTHKYHTLLSTAPSTARNYRVGVEELKERIMKYYNNSPEVKAQLATYTPEAIVSGAVIIQPVRAYDYERAYKAEFIPQQQQEESKSTQQINNSQIPMSNKQQKKLAAQQLQQKQQQDAEKAKQSKDPAVLNPKNVGIPAEHMLYTGVIIGFVSESYLNISGHSTTNAAGKKVIVKKRKTLAKEAADAAAAAEAAAAAVEQDTKADTSIDFNNVPLEMLGDVENNALLKLAKTAHTPYRISREELQQIEKKKLTQFKQKTILKKELWQAERRIKHREEKGEKVNRKDEFLVRRATEKLAVVKSKEEEDRAARKKQRVEQKAERDAQREAQRKKAAEEDNELVQL